MEASVGGRRTGEASMTTIAIAAAPTKASSATMTRGRTKKDIHNVSISDYSIMQSYLT
jgi:hypothetical protein